MIVGEVGLGRFGVAGIAACCWRKLSRVLACCPRLSGVE